jgi:GR25 family glycosyltransferase involved in LPS biosynthesis
MKTFIINVSTNEVRKNHILALIAQHDCLSDYMFIHEGDMSAITDDILQTYFSGDMSALSPAVSCAYKHITAYKKILEDTYLSYSLILEDDIFLDKHFCHQLHSIISEIEERKLENYLISIEDSTLKYVKGSERKKNIFLSKQPKGSTAGAYVIDKKAAASILTEIQNIKCHVPMDWFHTYCADNNRLSYILGHIPHSLIKEV